jgi:hypothetical protein
MPAFEDAFSPLYVTTTYSQMKDNITFDYCFMGNNELLRRDPTLVPTNLMAMYPKHPEMQYLEAIKDIMETGKVKSDRTGTGIFGKFGY